jgi:ribosomal protein S18 acetylase RimI-like enzyme
MTEAKTISAHLKDTRDVTLRSPQKSDARAFIQYLLLMRNESHLNMNSPPLKPEEAKIENYESQILKQLLEESGFLLLAFDGEVIVGSFNLRPEPAPYLSKCASFGMAVLGTYQGLGLGSALLAYGLDQATSLGRTNITLNVRTFNERAIALYEKFGFRQVGTLHEYAEINGVRYDEFIYQRIVSARL